MRIVALGVLLLLGVDAQASNAGGSVGNVADILRNLQTELKAKGTKEKTAFTEYKGDAEQAIADSDSEINQLEDEIQSSTDNLQAAEANKAGADAKAAGLNKNIQENKDDILNKRKAFFAHQGEYEAFKAQATDEMNQLAAIMSVKNDWSAGDAAFVNGEEVTVDSFDKGATVMNSHAVVGGKKVFAGKLIMPKDGEDKSLCGSMKVDLAFLQISHAPNADAAQKAFALLSTPRFKELAEVKAVLAQGVAGYKRQAGQICGMVQQLMRDTAYELKERKDQFNAAKSSQEAAETAFTETEESLIAARDTAMGESNDAGQTAAEESNALTINKKQQGDFRNMLRDKKMELSDAAHEHKTRTAERKESLDALANGIESLSGFFFLQTQSGYDPAGNTAAMHDIMYQIKTAKEVMHGEIKSFKEESDQCEKDIATMEGEVSTLKMQKDAATSEAADNKRRMERNQKSMEENESVNTKLKASMGQSKTDYNTRMDDIFSQRKTISDAIAKLKKAHGDMGGVSGVGLLQGRPVNTDADAGGKRGVKVVLELLASTIKRYESETEVLNDSADKATDDYEQNRADSQTTVDENAAAASEFQKAMTQATSNMNDATKNKEVADAAISEKEPALAEKKTACEDKTGDAYRTNVGKLESKLQNLSSAAAFFDEQIRQHEG